MSCKKPNCDCIEQYELKHGEPPKYGYPCLHPDLSEIEEMKALKKPSATTSTAKEEGAPAEPEEVKEDDFDLFVEQTFRHDSNSSSPHSYQRGARTGKMFYKPQLDATRKRIAELSDKIEDAETLKELAQGWERQYHQAEGQIESLQKQLADEKSFHANWRAIADDMTAQRNELENEMEAYRSFLSKLYEGKTDILTFSFADELADLFSKYPPSDKQKL